MPLLSDCSNDGLRWLCARQHNGCAGAANGHHVDATNAKPGSSGFPDSPLWIKERLRLSPEPSCEAGLSSRSTRVRQVMTRRESGPGGRIKLASVVQRVRGRFCRPRQRTRVNNKNARHCLGYRRQERASYKTAGSSKAVSRPEDIGRSFPSAVSRTRLAWLARRGVVPRPHHSLR
jgi:hypothetical protein